MRITLLGVGEAFDPEQPNSAVLVEQDEFRLLIDCGHSVVPILWRTVTDPDGIDAVFLTHRHADHVVGLPPVLDRWSWQGRRKALLVVASAAVQTQLRELLQLLAIDPAYDICYAAPDDMPALGPFALQTAPTRHYVPNLALQLASGGRRFAFSGDGRPTAASLALFADADLLLHECWESDPAIDTAFHGDLGSVRGIAGPARIGLYHIRAGRRAAVREAVAGDARLFVPEAGETLEV